MPPISAQLVLLPIYISCCQGTAAVNGAVVDLTDAADSPSPAQRDVGPSIAEKNASVPADEQAVARVLPAPGMLSVMLEPWWKITSHARVPTSPPTEQLPPCQQIPM